MSNINQIIQTKFPLIKKNHILRILIAIGILLSILLTYKITNVLITSDATTKNAKEQVISKTSSAADKMDNNFRKLMRITAERVEEIETNKYSKQELADMAHSVLQDNPEVFGFCIAYKPYKYEKNTRLYAPYCDRKGGTIRSMQVENNYDYTLENNSGLNWYVKPLQRGTPGWTEPYFGSASSSLMAVYSVPFYGKAPDSDVREMLGVVSIVYSIDDIESYIGSLDFRGSGYAFMFSKDGVFISHPNKEYVNEQKNIRNASDGIDKSWIDQAVTSGTSRFCEYISEITGQKSWVFNQLIPSTGYTLGVVFVKDTLINDKDYIRQNLIVISVLTIFVLSILAATLLFSFKPNFSAGSLWRITIFVSVLLVLEISFIWFLSLQYSASGNNGSILVTDESTLNSFINEKNETAVSAHEEKLVTIPTGLFIQSLEFESSNNVKMTGYIWQKYANDVPENISRGFILPEAVSCTAEEAYTRKSEDGETVGWYFEATLRQPFDYSKYPLDNKDVWVRLWHKDFDRNIILTPDLNAYKLTDPKYLPGVEKSIVLSGWSIDRSFFSYVTNSYNTNFGINNYSGQDKFPELYYSIIISREFINPFISHLLPFIVMSFLLFGTLALVFLIEEKAKKFDFSAAGILAACAALFFSVILAHNDLRSSVGGNGILYLECFYFIMYAAIIFVIIDAFLVAFNVQIAFVKYKDNLLPKLAFWPVILLIILIITIKTFY